MPDYWFKTVFQSDFTNFSLQIHSIETVEGVMVVYFSLNSDSNLAAQLLVEDSQDPMNAHSRAAPRANVPGNPLCKRSILSREDSVFAIAFRAFPSTAARHHLRIQKGCARSLREAFSKLRCSY
jgi:hypothetical protein